MWNSVELCSAVWSSVVRNGLVERSEASERAKRGGNGGGGGKSLRRRWLEVGEGGWYLAKRGRSWVAVFSTAAFRSPISLRNSLALFLFFSHFFLDSSFDTAYSLLLIVHLSAYPSYRLLSPSSDCLTLPILSSFLSSFHRSILPSDGECRPLHSLSLCCSGVARRFRFSRSTGAARGIGDACTHATKRVYEERSVRAEWRTSGT